MKKLVYLFLLPVVIAACSSEPSKDTEKSDSNVLVQEDIYNFDKVEAFAATVADSVREASRKVFLNGIDLYRNQKQPEKAIAEFRKAILMCPDAKSYYELGNALMDIRNYEEAISSYHIAEQLNYHPLSKVMYNLACAYSMTENGEEGLRYVRLAIENGYANSKHLLSDTDLSFVRGLPDFKGVYEEAMSGVSSPEAALFDLFMVGFPDSQIPLIVKAEESQKIKLINSIAYDFELFVPQMVNPSFSREVGDEFYYLAKINETEKYVALMYAGVQVMYDTPPVYHILMTYDHNGKVIDKLEVGGFHYHDEPLKGYKIGKDMSVEVSEYQMVYEKSVDEFGYDNNPVSASEFLSKRTFAIQENGKIKQTSGEPMAFWRR
ncbi:MAG TPA: hypothetical protein PK637_09880 [Flavobacteriales bacterium]|nr:hypothetical protein [Flavobacteriales bacterium]HRE97064.1 hypothetical protein [Flavobacteriales bacterium]HRJ35205.1 hypothetical protein [Flavobacteriales bacterium]HRJ39397.1 hypothetical protein [Flavobacteriales bacterium]